MMRFITDQSTVYVVSQTDRDLERLCPSVQEAHGDECDKEIKEPAHPQPIEDSSSHARRHVDAMLRYSSDLRGPNRASPVVS